MNKSALSILFFVTIMLPGYGQDLDVFGPRPFVEILEDEFVKPWTPQAISSVANLEYVVLLDASTKSKAVTLNHTDPNGIEITDISNVHQTGATYGSLLRSIFQIVDINTSNQNDLVGKYQIKPVLHSYHAMNYSTTDSKIISVDIGSFYVDEASSSGYLLIEFTGTPTSIVIKASAQYVYNSSIGEQEENTSWTDQWIKFDGTNLTLTATEGDATAFYLANANDLIDMKAEVGSDFNPGSIDWQTNPFAAYPDNVWAFDNSDFFGNFLKDVDEEVQSQFGNSSGADAAASTALSAIETSLSEHGSSLRYDKEVYLTFRKNLLSHTFASTDIYNGQLGKQTVPYVYFTNASDDSGVPHPFMVVASHNTSSGPNFLIDVARPPGDGLSGSYAEQSITRNAVLETQLNKIPLKDYGLIENLLDNDLSTSGSLAADEGLEESAYDVFNYTGTASMGVAADGVVIYPPYNNNLRFAPVDAEITVTGIHVGRGMGLHYHADGHGLTQSGINLYNLRDYESKNHPPMIGFAYDGIALFGRHEQDHSSMEGYSIALDEYGGHDHGDFGYHYHAFEKEFTVEAIGGSQVTFNQNFLFVGAWKGKINDIPGFAAGGLKVLKEEHAAYYGGIATNTGGSGNILGLPTEQTAFHIYPNPTNGSIKLKLDGITRLTLTEINGRTVWEKNIGIETKSLELSGLSKGIYIAKGEGNRTSFVEKIIVH